MNPGYVSRELNLETYNDAICKMKIVEEEI